MRLRPSVWMAAVALLLLGTIAWADQIVLKDGTVYSGKFVRGDSNVVDFRILGRIETFKLADIAQIVFKEPELESSSAGRIMKTPAPPPAPALDPPQRPLSSDSQESESPRAAGPTNPPRTTGMGSGAQTAKGEVTLPVGTPITIRTSTNIDTDRNRIGDIFEATLEQPLVWGDQIIFPRGTTKATLEQPLVWGDQIIFPRGTTTKGRIAYAAESGQLSGQAQLILELTEIVANGRPYFLRTSDYAEKGVIRANRTVATVGGTAALGAIIGAIAGGGTGAAVGAASGAAVGTGVQVMTRGQVLKIPSETILEFRLQSPLNVER
jgi:hypothetical protein